MRWSPPDGYTMLYSLNALTIAASIYPKLSYDPLRDLAPVTQMLNSSQILVTNPDEEYRFIEFFVPSEYRTVWANTTRVCTWVPTGKDSRGQKPVREIATHDSQSAAEKCPEDI